MFYTFNGRVETVQGRQLNGDTWKCCMTDSRDFPFLSSPRAPECHLDTDELFVVLEGNLHVGLSVSPGNGMQWQVLYPGDGIRVAKGVWHTTYVTEPSRYLIQELLDTDPSKTLHAQA